MRRAPASICLTAAILIVTGLGAEAVAGKKRTLAHGSRGANSHVIKQIGRSVSKRPSAAIAGYELARQFRASRKRAVRAYRGLDGDTLVRQAENADAPILKEFGLPYIAGVPTVAILLPPSPAEEHWARNW